MNPDQPYKRMGGHVFEVDGVDLSEQGYPGLSFSGWIDVGVDNDVPEWLIEGAHATNPKNPKQPYHYDTKESLGAAIIEAVLHDARLCELIEDACYYHGED